MNANIIKAQFFYIEGNFFEMVSYIFSDFDENLSEFIMQFFFNLKFDLIMYNLDSSYGQLLSLFFFLRKISSELIYGKSCLNILINISNHTKTSKTVFE